MASTIVAVLGTLLAVCLVTLVAPAQAARRASSSDDRAADERRRLLLDLVRDRVLVSVENQEAFLGVLYDADQSSIELREAELVKADGTRVPVDGGSLTIERAHVLYVQRVV